MGSKLPRVPSGFWHPRETSAGPPPPGDGSAPATPWPGERWGRPPNESRSPPPPARYALLTFKKLRNKTKTTSPRAFPRPAEAGARLPSFGVEEFCAAGPPQPARDRETRRPPGSGTALPGLASTPAPTAPTCGAREEGRKGGSDPPVALTHSKQTHFQLAYRHHLPGARPLRIPGAPHCPSEAAQPRRGRPRRRSHAPGPASPLPPAPSAAGTGTERARAGNGAASRAPGRAGEGGGTEWLEMEGTCRGHLVLPSCQGRVT